MTLTMADSITPANLPPGYDAYLGYVDGSWPTTPVLRSKFPGARVLSLTVLGGDHVADGCDVETGDLSPASGAAWAARRLAAGAWRPVVYASASTMPEVISTLASAGVARASVRLLSAHYGGGEHVCGPATCKLVPVAMDGTQWTDSAPGAGGSRIDATLLLDGFFGGTSVPASTSWQETMMLALPVLKQGASGEAVRTVQGGLCARHYTVTIDGAFGPKTDSAVRQLQAARSLGADGAVGPQTWPALMDV